MSVPRSRVRLEDASAWVFNRMAGEYDARPPYPAPLLDALAELVPAKGRVVDVGAGTGHVALPLAERGLRVTAIDPALAMLQQLARRAQVLGVSLPIVHAMAETLPLPDSSFEVAIVADAMHFLNVERAAPELARVLTQQGALAIVTCEFADTPFMCAVAQVMAECAPRRPRALLPSIVQLAAVVGAQLSQPRRFDDATPVDPLRLEAILRSISFIGPAMNEQRFEAFRTRIHGLSERPNWARTFTLFEARRAR